MPFFFWHQTNILLCNFTSRSIPLALTLITKSSAIAKLSFAATKSCPVLIMMLASSLTILGMHLQSEAQHCSFYTLFSNVGTVLVIAVCCKISSSLCSLGGRWLWSRKVAKRFLQISPFAAYQVPHQIQALSGPTDSSPQEILSTLLRFTMESLVLVLS